MKLLAAGWIVVLGTASATTVSAAPALNDVAFFTGTMKAQGRTVALTYEVALVQYDAAKQSYLQRTTMAMRGNVDEAERWLHENDVMTTEAAAVIVEECDLYHGKKQEIVVPAGTFESCAIASEDQNGVGMVWVAAVPFGIVKEASVSKDGKMQWEMELETYSPAPAAH